ncbi:MAG TPA: hypothetical protein VF652_11630 [Allosphingosinicella sp.]|jgi:hypothetical protein
MSALVLRCPNCGTVQSAQGECETCREAAVRYYCTNHVPGIWVDSPSCPKCGARFGEAAPAPEAPRPPERPRPSPTLEPDPPRGGTGDHSGPWASDPGPGGIRPPSPDLGSLVAAMLGAAARSRRGRGDRPGREEYEEYEEAPPRRRRGGGCLGRLLMLALLLFALFLMAPVLIGALLGFR